MVEPSDAEFEAKVRAVTGVRRRQLIDAINGVLNETAHGTWGGGQQVDSAVVDGVERQVLQMPYVHYTDAVNSLIQVLDEAELILPFGWMSWTGSARDPDGQISAASASPTPCE